MSYSVSISVPSSRWRGRPTAETPRRSIKRFSLWLLATGFATNLLWENLQAPLFQGYQNFLQHFWLCLAGTVGDAVLVLVLYFAVAAARRDAWWMDDIRGWDILLLVALGFGVAVAIERFALNNDLHAYRATMPQLKTLAVGLVPVAQMMLLPFLSALAAWRITRGTAPLSTSASRWSRSST